MNVEAEARHSSAARRVPRLPISSRMHRAARGAAPLLRRRAVEAFIDARQVVDDALKLDFRAIHQVTAFRAVPLEGIDGAQRPGALDHRAQAVGLGTLGRVANMGGQEEDVALVQVDAFELAAVCHQQVCIAFELVKVFLERIVVEVRPLIGSADHGHDQVRVFPDLLVSDRRLEQVLVLGNPLGEIDGFQDGVSMEIEGAQIAMAALRFRMVLSTLCAVMTEVRALPASG